MRAQALTFKRAKRLRREMGLPEVILWDCLRKGRLVRCRFRRQHPIGVYIYCVSARLAVEVDGEGHGHPSQIGHDMARDRWLKAQGLRVLRIAATAILDHETLSGVLAEIEAAAAPSTPSSPPASG